MNLLWNEILFQLLNVINGKTGPYGSKVVLRHYHYWSDPKLGLVVVVLRIIPCSCDGYTTQLSLPYYCKIKDACNKPRYGIV